MVTKLLCTGKTVAYCQNCWIYQKTIVQKQLLVIILAGWQKYWSFGKLVEHCQNRWTYQKTIEQKQLLAIILAGWQKYWSFAKSAERWENCCVLPKLLNISENYWAKIDACYNSCRLTEVLMICQVGWALTRLLRTAKTVEYIRKLLCKNSCLL